jgi:hypothetical protein
MCTLGHLEGGQSAEADRLEGAAAAQMIEGQRSYYDRYWLRLMLARADLQGVERLVGSFDLDNLPDNPYRHDLPPAVLDALVALRDHKAIERVAPRWLRPQTYAEPFALRALGVARGDAELLGEASSRFRSIGLDWRADETERWRADRIDAS